MERHTNGRRGIVRVALSAWALACFLAGCGSGGGAFTSDAQAAEQAPPEKGGSQEGLLVLSAEEARKAGIEVRAVEPQEQSAELVVTGTIQANQDRLAHVSPRVPGRIVRVEASLGDRVREGQTLARLDSMEMGEAYLNFEQAQSEAALARANFNRAAKLYREHIVPEKEYLRARAEHEKARAALHVAAEKLRMLGVNPNSRAGSVFALKSPFSGTVIEKHAVLGELARPDESLFTVADLSTLWIEADLYEKDLAKVMPGLTASVSVSAYPGERFTGRLTYISSLMDRATRTVKARVEVPNPDGRLKPEMFASVAIATAGTVKALRVPEEAVVLVQGQPTVFVAERGGYEPRPVELGDRAQGHAEIRSGVEPGERIVVSGAYALKARLLKSQIGEAD